MHKILSPHRFELVETNGIRLHALIAGNPNNELIILLHGFPEFYLGWTSQVDNLVNAGYFVIVPSQRGYYLSDKPVEVEAYLVRELAADIIGLIDFANKSTAYIAGHDWGGSITYFLGMNYPNRIKKIVVVNSAISEVLLRNLYRSSMQRIKSGYMFLFTLTNFSNWLLSRRNFEPLKKYFFGNSIKGTFSDEMLIKYKEAWATPNALKSMLTWYKAAFSKKNHSWSKPVNIPLLMIWGENDFFLTNNLAKESAAYATNVRIEYIENASHWVIHEFPERVSELILVFLKE